MNWDEPIVRKRNGQFSPKYRVWAPEIFNEGWVSNKLGRFFVRQPSHHRANASGWVLRSILNYEFHHKIKVTRDFVIHHKDGNKLNDHIDNLEMIEFSEHSKKHNPKGIIRTPNKHLRRGIYFKCVVCSKKFYRAQWVINHNGMPENLFCGTKCRDSAKGRKLIAITKNKKRIEREITNKR